uniref:Uncharacterized protein n=1 Tax=Leersia perrieri TaxID=77586 RepID=A0A0D9VS60_9ORYZ
MRGRERDGGSSTGMGSTGKVVTDCAHGPGCCLACLWGRGTAMDSWCLSKPDFFSEDETMPLLDRLTMEVQCVSSKSFVFPLQTCSCHA